MTFTKRPVFSPLFVLLTMTLLVGCDTTRIVYKSAVSKKDYWTINAVTLSHCGCTQLYVDHFKDGKKDFQIFYNDNLARKTIYTDGKNSKTPSKVLLATPNNDFTTPFDLTDIEIFKQIDSVIINKKGIVYPLKRTEYKGYINDPYYSQ